MLRSIMLRKKLNELRAKLSEAQERAEKLKTRETELEAAIEEAQTDEEKEAVSQAVEEYEKEKEENAQDIKDIEQEVSETEAELAEIEAKQRKDVEPDKRREEKRGEIKDMAGSRNTRKKFFGMTYQERDAFLSTDDVKQFLERVRDLGSQNRAVSGAELAIPTIVLDLLKENIEEYSKLYKHVFVRKVPGRTREIIQGTVPEAIWTEMCATLNELSLEFNDMEIDGYMVGGFFTVCNAILQDTDINLAETIITALGQAIGRALDKAIIYGKGTKMPLGIMTRLAQTAKPSAYPNTARTWRDLTQTNIKSIAASKTGTALFKELIINVGAAKGKYSKGDKFWVMNEQTHTKLTAEALSFNAAGAIASGMNKTMPIIGGDIENLDFIPNDVIIGGYGDLYLLAEREGSTIERSEHVKFIQNQTVFKGTARYDGAPSIAEAFVAIGINGVTPTAEMTFAEDTANKTEAENE